MIAAPEAAWGALLTGPRVSPSTWAPPRTWEPLPLTELSASFALTIITWSDDAIAANIDARRPSRQRYAAWLGPQG